MPEATGMQYYAADELSQIRKVFDVIDRNRDGKLSQSEFAVAMKQFGHDLTGTSIEKIFDDADLDHNGSISFDEFTRLMAKIGKTQPATEEDNLKAAFKLFDKDKNGRISKRELQDGLRALGNPMTEEEIDVLMKVLDIDKDGTVDFSEFKRWMLKK